MDGSPSEAGSPFQKIDKTDILGQCPLFSGLSLWELKSIGQLMRIVEFRRDELVYQEGLPADGFYVIVSGRFEAYVTSGVKKKVLAYLRRGDHFGEMSLLTQEAHSATVRALSDSLVLELKKDDFETIIKRNATISFELSRRLSHRLRGDNSRVKTLFRSDVYSVYSHQPKSERAQFSLNLAASLFHETHQKTVLVDFALSSPEPVLASDKTQRVSLKTLHSLESSDADPLSGFCIAHEDGFSVLSLFAEAGDVGAENNLIAVLNHLAIDYRFIIIDLPEEMNALTLRTLTQSDFIFMVTDSHMNNVLQTQESIADIEKIIPASEGCMAIVMREIFFGVRATSVVRRELFSKKRCFSLPVAPLLDSETRPREPVVVHSPDEEYSRVVRHIARYVSNNLVGLVLGSGAALGLAHIGVLKVLEREKIPIDVIAGSSIGALLGSVYAVGQTAQEVEKIATEISPWILLTRLIDASLFPVRGFLNGKGIMRHLNKYLEGKSFENSRIPLKITGANLSTRESIIFESGMIADAVRASIAIPAIFKPVFIDGDTIVDGGILNPLPIKALHDMGVKKIIAVNVFPTTKDTLERRLFFEDVAQREEERIKKKGILSRGFYRFKKMLTRCFSPNIVDILMSTIQHMESEIAEIEGQSADVLIRPVLINASWVDFYKPGPFIKCGEEEALRLLPKIKALVSQQSI